MEVPDQNQDTLNDHEFFTKQPYYGCKIQMLIKIFNLK